MQRAWWVCAAALVVVAVGCGDDDGVKPPVDAGADSSQSGAGGVGGAGSGGIGGAGGIGGTGGTGAIGDSGMGMDSGVEDAQVDANNCECPSPQTCEVGTNACVCPVGFMDAPADGGELCVDIDECAGSNDCGASATCMNTPGAYVCVCDAGYEGNDCTDIDECLTNNGGCDAHATCTNTDGSFSCACDDGFTGDGVTCADINECTANTDNCDNDPDACVNTDGSFSCVCPDGYNGNGITCTDINECATNNGGCSTSPMVTCTNTPGSRTCGACPSGYNGDGITCTDINECATNNGGCSTSPMVTCTNTPGSRTCAACPTGYTGSGVGNCTDINECATNNGGCSTSPMVTCTNTVGSRTCGACPTGYTGNGVGNCVDVNECLTNNGGCSTSPMVSCTNTPGGRTCGACPTGYTGNGVGNCVDVNECATNNGGCSTNPMVTCTNTPGSRTCGACPAGYTGNGVGNCMDINECATNNGGCSTSPMVSCTNTPGGRTCGACPTGYTGNGVGNCMDVNECATNNGGCSTNPMVTCTNTPGSRTCGACPAGYSGTGVGNCVDINQCTLDTDTCDDTPNACINLIGGLPGYRCECPTNYNDANGDGSNCVLACTDCDDNANCVLASPGNYQCQCDASEHFVGDGESCRCDLSGTWAVRVSITVDWPATTVGNPPFALQIIKAGTATLNSYELRTFDYDGTTLDMTSTPCGGNDADLCGTGLWNNRAFGQTIPNSVWQSFAANPPSASMTLAGAVPGTAFNTTNAAVFLGMRFTNGVNDLTYWSSGSAVDPNIVFDDPENPAVDDGIGFQSNIKTTGTTQCGSGYTYSRWPNPVSTNFELTAFRSGSRSVSRFAGDVISCDEIGGDLLGPDRNPANTIDVPRVDARVASCTVTPSSGVPRACNAGEVEALNAQPKSQRVLSAQFSMIRVANNATCTTVRNATYPTY